MESKLHKIYYKLDDDDNRNLWKTWIFNNCACSKILIQKREQVILYNKLSTYYIINNIKYEKNYFENNDKNYVIFTNDKSVCKEISKGEIKKLLFTDKFSKKLES